MREIFKDKTKQAEFARQGYVIVKNVFSPTQIDELERYHYRLHTAITENFFTSTYSPDKSYRKEADLVIQNAVAGTLQNLLIDYNPVYGNFMVKKSAPMGESELHQDWTFVDEAQFIAINAWSPLTDYKAGSGFIRIVKASDRFEIPYRGRNIDSPLGNIRELIKSGYTTEIEINRGDTVIFNTRSFHCSADNICGETRVAVSLVLIPKEAQLLHYMMSSESSQKIDVLEVDTSFFTDFGVWEKPEGLEPSKSFDYECRRLTDDEFMENFKKFNYASPVLSGNS